MATVELARAAAIQDSGRPDLVGAFSGADVEDDVAVTIRFATTDPAYIGWSWCVTVALVNPEQPTVSEVVLLPGPDSLLPPPWLPWSERVRPGDLGPGDLLVPDPNDPRVVPAYLQSDDPSVEDVAFELGNGRVRVLSRLGRIEAAERWHEGDFGPDTEMAKAALAHCLECAFFLPLAGSLAVAFGVCANQMSPADGRVVDMNYGCGAHSELVIDTGFGAARESRVDDLVLDVHIRAPVVAEIIDPAEIELVDLPRAVAPEEPDPERDLEPDTDVDTTAQLTFELAPQLPEPDAAEQEDGAPGDADA